MAAGDLPYGRKRTLEIATTLALEPELLLLDEPTQGMGHGDVDRVKHLIKQVSAGRSILMVEHNMKVVADICDTITVLQRGEILAEGPYAEVSANPRCAKRTWERKMNDKTPARSMLEIRDLHAWYGESHILHGIDLDVKAGECITLLGRNGAGRSSTLKSVLGTVGRRSGSIKVQGQETIGLPPHKIARQGIGYCPKSAASMPR